MIGQTPGGRIVVGCRGVTLLELLIALSIFAIISAMAYSGLNAVLRADRATEASMKRLSQLQRSLVVLARDLKQYVERSVRDEYGEVQQALVVRDGESFEWTRTGWRNPAEHPRSSLQRVGFSVEEETLVRSSWRTLDRGYQSEADKAKLLDGVLQIRVRVMDDKQGWHNRWPQEGDQTEEETRFPHAVEVTLETRHWGDVTRLVVLPLGVP